MGQFLPKKYKVQKVIPNIIGVPKRKVKIYMVFIDLEKVHDRVSI